jgi:hypothetical protein
VSESLYPLNFFLVVSSLIYPFVIQRANHKTNGGPAPGTNGGTAMLVMRNFGYLGLHPVIDIKSSLARARLVDYTGELQIRRRSEAENNKYVQKAEPEQIEGYKMKLPEWCPQFVAEPTLNGGRILEGVVSTESDISTAKSYAQELFPLPIQLSQSSLLSNNLTPGVTRGLPVHDDIESFYNTSFCNELLCHPRILHNCPKGNVVIKVELRELEWNESHSCYLSHLPSCGPTVHNTRRGPFLVQSSFSACTSRRSHQFMDEFKIKLPLDLKPKSREGGTRNLSLFFTLFKIKLGSKGRWKRGAKLLFGSNTVSETMDAEENGVSGSTRLNQIACGFLPLTEQSCLIENGIHDVRIGYKATPLTESMSLTGLGAPTTFMLKDIFEDALASAHHGKEDSCAEDTTVSENSFQSEKPVNVDASGTNYDSSNDLAPLKEDSQLLNHKVKSNNDPMSLSVSSFFPFKPEIE